MWYGPGTHEQPLRAHRKAGPAANAPLTCDATEDEMVPMPLIAGECHALGGGYVYRCAHSLEGEVPRWVSTLDCR